MDGDAKAKFCKQCRKHVHNLTEMTVSEADQLIASSETRLCVRYVPDASGAPIFKGNKAWHALLAAGALAMAGCQSEPHVTGEANSPQIEQSGDIMGKVAVDPNQIQGRAVLGTPAPNPQPGPEVMGDVPVPPRNAG